MTYISRFVYRVSLLRSVVSVFWAVVRRWFKTRKCVKEVDTHYSTHLQRWTQYIKQNMYLPRKGDFMAASTIPTSSCRLLGSWASPEAKAARASAWRPRYWRATPCRKYACRRKEGRHMVYKYTLVAACIFIFSYVNMPPVSFLFLSHKWRIIRYLCLLIATCFT